MACDKYCPMLNTDTDDCKGDVERPLRDKGSICDDCIHDEVCGEEGHLDPAMTFCAEKISKATFGLMKRVNGLFMLSDIAPYINGTWFTVIRTTGEPCNQDTYRHPENYKVISIGYDHLEEKIVVAVDPV